MRVLFWQHSSGQKGMYGGDLCLLNLASELNKTVEVAVTFPDAEGALVEAMQKAGIKVYILPKYGLTIYPAHVHWIKYPVRICKERVKRWRAMRYLKRVIDDFHPDIIHTNVGPLDHAHFVAKKHGIPHVWHLREYQDKDFDMHFIPSKGQFLKLLQHPNNHCIAITKDIFRHFGLHEQRDRVIYDGVFAEKTDNSSRPEKGDFFLFVGRAEVAKGLHDLIDAYIDYVAQGGTFNLLVAGGEHDSAYFRQLRQKIGSHGLDNKVRFLGFRSDCYDLMAKAAALVVPSRFEGFGFITAEAMYNNCLVIGRNTAGTKEQLDNGLRLTHQEIGLRFNDNHEITQHLLSVERNGQAHYADMIGRAFATVNQLYTVQACVAQVKKFYMEILATQPQPPAP